MNEIRLTGPINMQNAPMIKPQIRLMKQVLMVLSFLALYAGSFPASGQDESPKAPTRKILKYAAVFDAMPGVDVEDVRLTLEILISKSKALKKAPYNVKLDFITEYTEAVDKIISGGYHFVIATGMDYFDLNRRIPMTPLLILSLLDQPAESLVLVTRKGKSLAQFNRKAGATIMIDQGRIGVMSRIWLDTMLMESGYDPSRAFFSKIGYSRKSSRILLPVFFGKADACIITRSTFDLMVDLNPQIAKTLTIERQSEELVFWVICATALAEPEDRRIISDKKNWLTDDPDVQQALTLVRMKQFFLFKDSYFKATADLLKRYERLTAKKREKMGASEK